MHKAYHSVPTSFYSINDVGTGENKKEAYRLHIYIAQFVYGTRGVAKNFVWQISPSDFNSNRLNK